MSSTTMNLFLLDDLQDVSRAGQLADSDLMALQAISDWIRNFVVKPHKDLGRAGTVCPFVPGSLERNVLWLAPEHIAVRSKADVVELVGRYRRLLQEARPTGGDDADYKVIVVVFTDLPADRAQGVFDNVLQHLAIPSYADDRILYGPYCQGNETTAIYNSRFRPFQSPVPFLFVRYGVISDWKFFVDNDEMLNLWPRRYGDSGVRALVAELRRTNWRQIG
jgi:hypothetical protein